MYQSSQTYPSMPYKSMSTICIFNFITTESDSYSSHAHGCMTIHRGMLTCHRPHLYRKLTSLFKQYRYLACQLAWCCLCRMCAARDWAAPLRTVCSFLLPYLFPGIKLRSPSFQGKFIYLQKHITCPPTPRKAFLKNERTGRTKVKN